MNQFTKKKHFVGVDISKEHLDLALIGEHDLSVFSDKKVENNLKGFNKIKDWLTKERVNLDDCMFCMEHTGTYGLLLFVWLSQMNIDYCVEPAIQIKRSLGLTRGKNDRVDARRIAVYAHTNREQLDRFSLPSNLLLRIKQLLTYRDQQTKIKVSLMNSLKNHNQYQEILGSKEISNEIQHQIDACINRIENIDKQIKELIKSDVRLKKNYELTTSVKGIGPLIAAFMLVTTNNFTSFENGRKYACYCGIAPFANSSGKYQGRSKVSHLANKKVKALLSSGASSAYKWDPEIKSYYQRKLKEGKHHFLIMNAIRCKLVNRIFAVVNRQTPYVNIYREKVA
jgi:transposase